MIGALEEVSDTQIQRNFETNLFGAIWMIRAVLPIMRQQKSGHIINMSAIAGFANELGFSIYGGAKFALEGVSEALYGADRWASMSRWLNQALFAPILLVARWNG